MKEDLVLAILPTEPPLEPPDKLTSYKGKLVDQIMICDSVTDIQKSSTIYSNVPAHLQEEITNPNGGSDYNNCALRRRQTTYVCTMEILHYYQTIGENTLHQYLKSKLQSLRKLQKQFPLIDLCFDYYIVKLGSI